MLETSFHAGSAKIKQEDDDQYDEEFEKEAIVVDSDVDVPGEEYEEINDEYLDQYEWKD